ncbi:MAG: HAD-IIA family hydrolase [Candidatus Aenigmarchaeota archaeon]|nr:HAD-IIA family hydrolase [Candidatus Aenigmarchaeota archaeon]MDW8160353.1 HAD-IIA family hydrolase [Candidatus Aenigmarchaeota archaeon]
MNIKKFDYFIFDLDGTFWNYPSLIEGSEEVYKRLIEMGKKVLFVSNFTYLDRDGIVKIFKRNGIDAEKNQIITSGYVASVLLKGKKVFPIGDGLKSELKKNGIKVGDEDVDAVVVGHDVNYNYKKATKALKLLLEGSEFYTTAIGRVWIFKDEIVPGTGLIFSGLEFCSGKKAIMLGKPSNFMVETLKKMINDGKVIYFGDEAYADMEFAKKAGFYSVFVRSGVDKNIKKVKANLVLDSLKDLLKFLE